MIKSTHTTFYQAFRAKIVRMRKDAGISQRELAQRLGREHSFVARMELGDRRIDIVELCWISLALGQEPEVVLKDLLSEFRQRGLKAPRSKPKR